ncbi:MULTISPECIES: small ribosomal subunit biogenesis GTPase RsgA [unclassified Coleofasciculus]|uniref:small ribosomal subunit biogenesis GTPase RsgA n=1 Tax=unclassified Coleofasciculus TaxID=2692782 RepID=UPI001882F7BD|nr:MULTISPECIES: small ribosomal subunit biogenesis GTPase RsgA [unclassified Coleofasciculus]MBE9127631.1 small ribosomal subunit biogenesis GTPase RsgA [Coleofasciculus sp. LEGE 07081]MBE9150984.1 small ribosomal subunit biogenesis GTPase RsgA [Coleofasciculus sp. LEGE 07092]
MSEIGLGIERSESSLVGTVLAVQANFYQVQLDEKWGGTAVKEGHLKPQLLCTRRSRLKKIGQKVMVGDRVVVEEPDWGGGRGAIADVLPRKTQLDRPPIANAAQILLVFALEEPTLDPYQLSRFLVKAESTGLSVCLCLNKSDLVTAQARQEWQKRLGEWGYQPIFMSVYTKTGLEEVNERLSNTITVLAGLSGVGKSSLINQLAPEVNLRVGEVTGKLGRGRHTTRHIELFELPTGGLLADTPGFNQPDLDCEPKNLAYYFPEAQERLAVATCQFSDCLHRDEPNCVVRGDWERYEHYLDFLDVAIARRTWLNQQSDPESTMKAKMKGKGQMQYEPKLETKKYRRHSRRTQQQELEQLYQEAEDL